VCLDGLRTDLHLRAMGVDGVLLLVGDAERYLTVLTAVMLGHVTVVPGQRLAGLSTLPDDATVEEIGQLPPGLRAR